jgi:hypothetical protein
LRTSGRVVSSQPMADASPASPVTTLTTLPARGVTEAGRHASGHLTAA